jgi:hypothetical protein
VRSEEDAAVLNKWLLEGPDIVIADEAHEIKNEKSMIGKLLAGVKTTSRIALSGSPLSNHLQEYSVTTKRSTYRSHKCERNGSNHSKKR